MITIKKTQRKITINVAALKRNAQKMLDELGYSDFDLGVWLTTNKTIRQFNKRYRGKDVPTDILSFPFHQVKAGTRIHPQSHEEKNLGDLIISLQFVMQDAPRWGESLPKRLTSLLAHGIAHLLGYDHQTKAQGTAMKKIEEKLLKAIK